MTVLALVGFWGTLGFIVLQASLVSLFVKKLSQSVPLDPSGQEENSSVAIVLCVRGVDPSLGQCVQALLDQDYSRAKIVIVGDCLSDPGIELCREFQQQHPEKIEIQINQEVHESCGLKCSNLIYALGRLESDFDFFLLADADTVPTNSWVREMIAPFENADVQVTTGIRWFNPVGTRPGTWVRYIWNTAAIVQMVCYRIPWGGSLALRTSFLRDAEVLDAWSRGFCEDTMLRTLVGQHGGSVQVVPEAVIHSSEETSLGKSIPWISRQLLTARLHHPFWPLVLGHGCLTLLLSFGLPILLIVSLAMGLFSSAGWLAAAYGMLQVGNVWLLNWIESPIRKRSGNRSSLLSNPLLFLVSLPLTQLSYVVATAKALWARVVEWRQIQYRIRGKRVTMIEYQPYTQATDSESL